MTVKVDTKEMRFCAAMLSRMERHENARLVIAAADELDALRARVTELEAELIVALRTGTEAGRQRAARYLDELGLGGHADGIRNLKP